MYEKIKALVFKVVPKSWIKTNEQFLRKVISTRYKGHQYRCNVCDFEMKRFIILQNGNKICPHCGSLPRTRRLLQLIESEINELELLHFSPSLGMKNKIIKLQPKKYVTSDYEGEFQADKQYDIQNIACEDASFNAVICFHVLEHIPDDKKAMQELFRILKPAGKIYIQTPFKEGEIYEDASIVTSQDRRIHFGQEDHVRVYAVEGLKQRLEATGFVVEIKQFVSEPNNELGFEQEEIILIAEKKARTE